jgi:aspartyl-tRNA(Asn)/glutamyl-tRNA(Gln) amidotransferase subunit C
MVIDEKQIRRLEELARLELAPGQRERMAHDLKDILSYMAELSALDTADVPPFDMKEGDEEAVNVFREDRTTASPGPDLILSGAPASKEGQFKAPKSFE